MLEQAFAWIGEYARGLLSVLPQRRIVRAGHTGIRYGPRGGISIHQPGWHAMWPLIHEWEIFPVTRQTVAVPNQALMTKDGKTVTANGVIRFSVTDVSLFCVENLNTFEDIDDIAQIAVRDVVMANDLATLHSERRKLDTELRQNAQRRLESYGVKVHDLNLKGLAPAKLIHIVSDHPVPAVVHTAQGDSQ